MLDALNFVKGAVAKKDYQPVLTHFRIGGGRVLGYNGTIALSSPIDLEISAMPKAIPFVKAIERCEATTALALTPGGKLSVRSGRFSAFIECSEDTEILDRIVPEGSPYQFEGGLLEGLRTLEPFIATDASRPWATGILLRGQSMYATNNIIIAQYWLGTTVPDVNLPDSAITELLRIKEEPIGVMIGERSMTFFYTGDRWMRTQLLATDWPNMDAVLDACGGDNLKPFVPGFFEMVETLAPFVEEIQRIHFREDEITTSTLEGVGASVDLPGIPDRGAFNYKYLMMFQDHVQAIDFSPAALTPPKPCPFRGHRLRGVILPMHDE